MCSNVRDRADCRVDWMRDGQQFTERGRLRAWLRSVSGPIGNGVPYCAPSRSRPPVTWTLSVCCGAI